MRFLTHLLLMFAVALAVGFGLSWYALSDGRLFGAYRVGPWAAWPAAGSPTPDPYTRAHIARTGALQLGQSEGLEFVASTDSQGRPLDRACTYRVHGTTPVASFWTLVAEAQDGTNIARSEGEEAMHSARLARNEDGTAVIFVGKRLSPLNWLEITGDGPFSLALTLYDTAAFGGVGSGADTLPAIDREDCA
ncbi:hypothetical protein GCM10011321_04260 [Youhaiella tibetensis]|uniref:DUF1214 domain-containing protein n=1 Tax=Paradevosia tibetensis TaxID=1447062 RepID=A0A5B9DRH4_9HYPH|nr:DUF1214 domain-containing protein [Youhaiella tibetensis]QEE21379.1 DUF1214 domain-containing protein [Youhaiella tibetensis]GGF15521.1 hypothetical protein GCM10011321_04260 [Youhaiella tibetensis]